MFSLIDLMQNSPPLALFITATFSLLIGSFLNVVIYRLPIMMERDWQHQLEEYQSYTAEDTPENTATHEERFNLAFPPSSCPSCQTRIRWYQNIPIISYLVLKGRCGHCKSPISLRYPAIEVLTAILSCWVVATFGVQWITLALLFLTWCLIVLTFIDIDHQLLPDSITLPLIWIGLLLNTNHYFVPLEQAVWGAAVGYMLLWSIFWLFKLLTGKEGMGYGDFKLLAALGAWLGASQLPLIILLSSFVGAVFGIFSIITKRSQQGQPIPFGPYLAIAGWLAIFWGNDVIYAYLAELGL